MKEKAAKLIRTITVPPILALSMLLILRCAFVDQFATIPILLGAALFLVAVPICAYPAAKVKGGNGETVRNRQRQLAFGFNLLGYAGAFIWGLLMNGSHMLLTVLTAYLIAVLLLTVLNKVFHIKASGHACSCVLPYLFLIYWLGLKAIIPCVLFYIAEFWASMVLKRHTAREFFLGSITALLAFACLLAVY